MATFANYFLPNPPTTTTSTSRQTHASLIVPNTTSGSTTTTNKLSSNWSSNFFTKPRLLSLNHHHHHHAPSVITPRSTAPSSSSSGPTTSPPPQDERVKRIHSISEFDEALRLANNKLVVVEFATAKSLKSEKTIYPFMVSLSRTCNDVAFLLVVCDESDRTRALSRRELEPIGVDLEAQQLQSDTGVAAPHFSFYKNGEKVHDESSVGTEQLVGDVLYYGDSHSAVVQLHGREDVEKLMEEHKKDGKLIVLDVGLKHCGPCVKVYPTVIKLSRQMEDLVVFARMNGDENESCMKFMKEMDVVEVPTFLFIRDGRVKGRYVGSGKGELIGEILRYQGVRVTY